ncbi:Protein of unknown function [Lactobacillus helveticus CIRM-BIA 953]|uniref:Uncharacterized protein n=1 Tax=Lactobacillus helveticus CIRM-BIA 953 TaxID=1226335 RepID=U4QJF8_LACHE|nr:Protein of unknown function [Lactobacillus helveticus CIRM-BIA 953]
MKQLLIAQAVNIQEKLVNVHLF